jgi:hypothetical protein
MEELRRLSTRRFVEMAWPGLVVVTPASPKRIRDPLYRLMMSASLSTANIGQPGLTSRPRSLAKQYKRLTYSGKAVIDSRSSDFLGDRKITKRSEMGAGDASPRPDLSKRVLSYLSV